jgi:beta-lactamase superfamily II metal-dependent hydrolase
MATSLTFFPVGNGDMTLICLGDKAGTTLLIDCNIRAAADDPEDKTRDVAQDLRDRLKRDSNGRPYVEAFLLTHPDQDHCRGIRNHFHLGAPADYADDKKPDNEKRITIGEIWSSPMVFRRASVEHSLCDDAKAFNKEAKRRVALAREKNCSGIEDGDRILILGEDEDGKTDDIPAIVVKVDEDITAINGKASEVFKARLLAPMPKSAKDEEEEELRKNHSSVILNIQLADDPKRNTVKNFLIGGDAEVRIWEKLWAKHKKAPEVLAYDLLQTPHHCSWHSLSSDSRSELGNKAKVSPDAKAALSQIRKNGRIVASSCPVKDDDCDPPCHAAKVEYESIAKDARGEFLCTEEHPTEGSPAPIEFTVSDQKLMKSVRRAVIEAPRPLTKPLIDDIARKAAEAEAVRKGGNSRYA